VNNPESSEETHPPIVGILGGICSGKTTVAKMLAERGFDLIDADRIGHEVLDRPEIKRRLREEFGREIFDADGRVERPKLARLVFGNCEATESLNSIVHPPILQEIDRRIRSADGPVVLDAALLVEKGLHEKCCDLLVFVHAPRQERLRRARQERNWDAPELQRREDKQISPTEKRRHADFVIDNGGTQTELERRIDQLTESIRETLARRC
jgi:dephospho-CoA kinase